MKLTPCDPDIFETASHIVSTEVEVGATTEACWAALNDHGAWVDWFPGCTMAQAQPDPWVSPGDTRTVNINRLTVHERAIIVEPESDFAFTILQWPLPIGPRAAERVQLQDTSRQGEERTNLVYTGAFDLNPIGRVIWPVLQKQLVDGWGTGFEQLHQYLERTAR